MTKILVVSDLHLEFCDFTIPDIEDEKETIVLLVGDIGIVNKPCTYDTFITNICSRFLNVIWIMGNHEYYHRSFFLAVETLKNDTKQHTNLVILEKESVIINDIAFIGATLWTSMDNNNLRTMNEAGQRMNDYKHIRNGDSNNPNIRALTPLDTISDHQAAKEFIFSEIVAHHAAGRKTVVLTHHLPSSLSVSDMYKGNSLNGAFVSELFEDIRDTQPNIWAHGHTHSTCEYHIGDTYVLCNPRGYHDENKDFNPTLTIEI